MSRHRARRALPVTGACGAVAVAAVVSIGAAPAAANADPGTAGCPGLMELNVEGTGETTPGADPDVTTGTLGTIIGPMLAQGVSIETRSIPYQASFGGAPGTGPGVAPFSASVTDATARLNATIAQTAARCPRTMFAVAGFSGGAVVASQVATQIGSGHGVVPADRMAGVALFADGTRPDGTQAFPGDPGRTTPAPAPGTIGAATSLISITPPPPSGGIAASQPGTGFGGLTGRVAEVCRPHDLACDAPEHAAVLRTTANVAARADLHNPVAAVTSLAAVAQQTAAAATTTAILNDVQIRAGDVNYEPTETMSDRLADAADPRTPPPDPQQTRAAADKINQVVAAVAADPLRQVPKLAGQLAAAIPANLAANRDVFSPQAIDTYVNTIASHRSYGSDGSTQQVADWFGALSRDIAGGTR